MNSALFSANDLFSNPDFQVVIDQMPGYFVFKDQKSIYLSGCSKTAKLLGYKHPEELIGISDYKIKTPASYHAETFIKQDKLALQSNVPQKTLNIYLYSNNEIKIAYAIKTRLLDINKNIIGSSCYSREINNMFLNKLIKLQLFPKKLYDNKKLNQQSVYIDREYPNLNLSLPQSQCLFFLLRGKSIKIIAKILKLSCHAVAEHFEVIMQKMNCLSIENIVEKAMDNDYIYIVPPKIFSEESKF